jgi:hypothetical protein
MFISARHDYLITGIDDGYKLKPNNQSPVNHLRHVFDSP